MSPPLVIAHRGSSAHWPENTLAAFEGALKENVDGVEFDLWKCGSGELVVTHDRDLKRLTGLPGDVEKLSLSELKTRDFGIYKGIPFRHERIPTLSEVLDLVKDLSLINIEIKGKSLFSNGIEKALIQILRQNQMLDRCILSSFNPAVLFRLFRLEPRARRGLIFYEGSSLPMRRAWTASLLRVHSLHPSLPLLESFSVSTAHKKNQKVIAWTVNNIHDLETCLQAKVDGMITDDPAWMFKALGEMG